MSTQTAIRDALHAIVTATASFTAANTSKSRYTGEHVPIETLPQSWIAFAEQTEEPATVGVNRSFDVIANWEIAVMAVPSPTLSIDEVLGGYVTEIRNAITDRTLGGEVVDCYISRVAHEADSEGEVTVGMATIGIVVEYWIQSSH